MIVALDYWRIVPSWVLLSNGQGVEHGYRCFFCQRCIFSICSFYVDEASVRTSAAPYAVPSLPPASLYR